MTQEDKQLLLKDLCGRLPYGTKIECGTDYDFKNDITDTCKLLSVNIDNELCEIQTLDKNRYVFNESLDTIKPYLRPMESMTEEEITEIYEFARPYIIEEIKHGAESDNPDRKVEIENGFLSNAVIIDELNKRHIDYRGLIPMGLALEAKEGMYNKMEG